jgi:hypothetical protein
MPHKGFITQTLAILLRKPPPSRKIEERLGEFKIARHVEASEPGGPSTLIAYRPDVNGYVLIDMVDGQWPDRMGDPKAEPEVFAAWASGDFGPGTWPGALERACLHSWVWPEGRSVPLQHQSFVRIRCSYVFGAGPEAPLMPSDYRPRQELEFVTRIAAALVRLPEAICYFNPNGECVRDASRVLESLSYHASARLMPLDLWSNIRVFKFNEMQPEWTVMDTVGMSQLDVPDHEAFYQSNAYEPTEVGNFLRNASSYVVEHGPVIRSGDTMDGPDNVRWQAFMIEKGRMTPPRPVIRWFPQDHRTPPAELTDT